jgi:hypothetical protein
MAEEVQIRNTGNTAKIRSPVAVAVFTIITLGIYGLVWWYKINREMADLGRSTGKTDVLGDNPTTSLLALFPGGLIIVPAIITTINTFKRLQRTQTETGGGEVLNGWLALVMFLIFSPIMYAYMQSGLNKAWEAERSGGGSAALGAAPESSATPQAQEQPQPPVA